MDPTSLSEGQCHGTSLACMQALSQQGYHAVWLCAKNGTLFQFYKQLPPKCHRNYLHDVQDDRNDT